MNGVTAQTGGVDTDLGERLGLKDGLKDGDAVGTGDVGLVVGASVLAAVEPTVGAPDAGPLVGTDVTEAVGADVIVGIDVTAAVGTGAFVGTDVTAAVGADVIVGKMVEVPDVGPLLAVGVGVGTLVVAMASIGCSSGARFRWSMSNSPRNRAVDFFL